VVRILIADSYSSRTVETHRSAVLRKLKIQSSRELVRYAIRNKMVEPLLHRHARVQGVVALSRAPPLSEISASRTHYPKHVFVKEREGKARGSGISAE